MHKSRLSEFFKIRYKDWPDEDDEGLMVIIHDEEDWKIAMEEVEEAGLDKFQIYLENSKPIQDCSSNVGQPKSTSFQKINRGLHLEMPTRSEEESEVEVIEPEEEK